MNPKIQRCRLSNGRVVGLANIPGGLRCPVCGSIAADGTDWWRQPEPIALDPHSGAYIRDAYSICECCGCEYEIDAWLGPEPEVFAANRSARAQWLRTLRRAPEVFQQVLWNLGVIPDHETHSGAERDAERATSGATELMAAVIGDDVGELAALVDRGALEARDLEGWTALHWAVALGNRSAVGRLLAGGADPSARTILGETPLMWAAWLGDKQTVEALVARGADVNAIIPGPLPGPDPGPLVWRPGDRSGQTALMWAGEQGHADVVSTLVSLGASVDGADANGTTALITAGSAAVVKELVRAGADVHAHDRYGYTAVLRAAAAGRDDLLRGLVEAGADLETRLSGRDGDSALDLAVGRSDYTTVAELVRLGVDVNARAMNGGTALQEAACMANPAMINALLRAGADVNARGYRSGTALMSSIFRFGPKLDNALTLLAAGADPNLPNQRGETPLMISAMQGRPPLVEALLRHGARVNDQDRKRSTALHRAVAYGAREIVRLLLAEGANPGLADWQGVTPLDLARQRQLSDIELLLRP